ncbi:hypothetical protein SPACI_012250 [Sporomusa acidovorans DSM 3132]|uniref:Double zinc ribbon n=1 Tax=Sporomusa acidovorans (strain ATCC 49682 / DSM 3132 / Mol) TaxID=1123286 RepID=A0ABZ3IYY3_SPOA4|nr:hypothetical protein SPACI_43240 [Sporomusa acidovorans DSM 3132]SDF73453.1 hypothetical protein SAMN04488499_10746 [Sporomusa acidovorans]
MCWSCNPYCGGCKPPKDKPKKCESCGLYNSPQLTTCKKCGADLPPTPKRPTVMCLYIGELCANPCNRHKKPPQDGKLKTCRWHTPAQGETISKQ